MHSNGREPIRASEMPLNKLQLVRGRVKVVACPFCDRWEPLKKSRVFPHNDDSGQRCEGAGQKIIPDVDPDEMAAKLMKAIQDVNLRKVKVPRCHQAADSPPPAPAVCQIPA